MAYTLAIANQKGGVGKTTTAVNLAASLAQLNKRVLLIDLDPQCNASSGVGVRASESKASSYGLLLGEITISAVAQDTELPTLKVVPATADLAAVEIEFVDLDDRAMRLREALRLARHGFDYVIIDCPPSLGVLTLNALVAADGLLVAMQCEYYALEGLSNLLNTVERVRSWNDRLHIEGVVLTMYDPRSNLAQQVAGEVRKRFKVYQTVIPRNIRLAEAPSFGKPACLYDPTSRGAQSYHELAYELVNSHDKPAMRANHNLQENA